MLDFLLVLGQIPGTHIELSFAEIIMLPFISHWLIGQRHNHMVWFQLKRLAGKVQPRENLKSFAVPLAALSQKPRQRLIRYWF